MSGTPTLQDLAFYARDHFGEDGHPFEDSIPSSFDVVVETYVHETDEEAVRRHAGERVREQLQTRGANPAPAQPDVDEFVVQTVTYLQSQYPEGEEAEQDEKLLSHLFWGHLVEARLAGASSRSPVPA